MTPSLDTAALFEHLPNALMVLDRELRYVTANAAYLRVTASTLEALVGRHVFDAFPDDPSAADTTNVAILRASFERVLATAKPDEVAAIKYRVARAPGGPLEERVWSALHTPILDAQGTVQFIIQETTEVTQLQQREPSAAPTHLEATVLGRAFRAQSTVSELDAQLRDLRQMFAQAPGFMAYTHGRDHVFALVNAAFLQLVGHRDVIGMRTRDALPEIVAQGFGLLDRVFDSGEPLGGRDVTVMLQRTPGAPLEASFLDFICQPIRDPDGHVIGVFIQGHDVTAQHRAQIERDASDATAAHARRGLAAAEARQRFLIESIPVQVWTSTPEGKLDFVSDRVVEYCQRSAEQILGDGWLSVLHPDDVQQVVETWTHSLATGDPYEVELRLRRGDGEYRWHLGRATPERDRTGKITGWFGTNTDIDVAKRALAELEARSEYEQRLIGIVSHDLRNPLNAIGLAGAALERVAQDEISQKMLAIIGRASNRANRLIRDLLDFASKRVGATIPVNPRPTNLRELIEHVVDELRVAVPNRTIRVEHTGAEDGSWDADRIAQVISNLVGNALQHGSKSTPVVVASRIEQETAVLEVTNHGPPISAADIDRLFEPFARAENAGPGAGNLGLGLYIAREVVVAHGGRIDVDSDADAGTRFTVWLPRFTTA